MADYILETKNLTKTFRHQTVSGEVSLAVRRGSVYVILGPNGAEKSDDEDDHGCCRRAAARSFSAVRVDVRQYVMSTRLEL